MKITMGNFFSKDYNERYQKLLLYQVILLLLFRLFTLTTTTKDLTGIPFITPNEIILAFSIVELVFSVLFLVRVPSSIQNQNLFMLLLAINAFFLTLYAEQFIISNNPLAFYSDDVLFVIIQISIIFLLFIYNRSNFNFKNEESKSIVILFIMFSLDFLSKELSTFYDIGNLLFLLANITGWLFLWLFIYKSMAYMYANYKWKAYIPLVVSLFLVMGMYMGMTRSLGTELAKTVFNTIIDQAFSLHSINSTIFGFNPEIMMIIIGLASGFSFIIILGTHLLIRKERRSEWIAIFIIGLTGLSALPLLAIFRLLALFQYFYFENSVSFKTKLEENQS